MNWIENFTPPGLKTWLAKRETPEDLWVKCPKSGELVYHTDLEENAYVTPAGAHLRIPPRKRFESLFDRRVWEAIPLPAVPQDPLKFKDDKAYTARLKAARAKIEARERESSEARADGPGSEIHQDDCMAAAFGRIGGRPAVVLVQDFAFMGGSLGMAAGEAFITAAQTAIARKAGFVVCTASGGARMQEGTLSLMQMPRTTLAVEEVREAGLPYLVMLTDPTSGGVSASYAMLGDVHLAEPDAMIAFSGPRVIEQTIRETLPEGFQRAEFLREHGMIDIVADRRDMAGHIGRILAHLMPAAAGDEAETERVTAPALALPPETGKPAAKAKTKAKAPRDKGARAKAPKAAAKTASSAEEDAPAPAASASPSTSTSPAPDSD